jgi:hypothetical protein
MQLTLRSPSRSEDRRNLPLGISGPVLEQSFDPEGLSLRRWRGRLKMAQFIFLSADVEIFTRKLVYRIARGRFDVCNAPQD